MTSIKRTFSIMLVLVLVVCAFSSSWAYAANEPETIVVTEDLGNDITVTTTVEIYRGITRYTNTSAVANSDFKQGGKWIATVTLKAYFIYNGMAAGVTGTEYAKSLASGWSYNNHNIATTTVSSSSGGTATLTATLKNFPVSVPVSISLHCAPNGTITTY